MRLLCTLLCIPLLGLAATVISDGVFLNSNWSTTELTNNSPGTTTLGATQILTGGNPDEYRETTHQYQYGGNGVSTVIRQGHEYTAASYTSPLPVLTIDYSYDLKGFVSQINGGNFNGNGTAYSIAIHQGNDWFIRNFFNPSPVSANWNSFNETGLTSTDFCLLNTSASGSSFICGTNPNFAAPMSFGYVTANSSPDPGGLASSYFITGIDNFSVTVNAETPEPATWALLAAGLMAVFTYRPLRR